MSNHAERSEPFIRYFLGKIGSCADVRISSTDLDTLPTVGGLYVFYVKFNPDSTERYPIYVGITGRSFRERFKEHADNGVIDKVENNAFPNNYANLNLNAYLVNLDVVTSKFIESILLEAFDFCLNKSENVAVRQNLDISNQYNAADCKHNFDISWGNIIDNIKGVDSSYRS